MEHKLVSEAINVYGATKDHPCTFRIIMKTKDPVNGKILEKTLGTAIKRYPYFQVRLIHKGEELFIDNNDEPIPIINQKEPVSLGGEQAKGHLMVLSWWEDEISISVHTGLTDETGIYQFIKTLLYYYCSKYYSCSFSSCRIRFAGMQIPEEEYTDPLNLQIETEPESLFSNMKSYIPKGEELINGSCISSCIRIPEKEYLDHAASLGCKLNIFTALIIARAFSTRKKVNEPVVIQISEDARTAIGVPGAHHYMRVPVRLRYSDDLAARSIEEQAVVFEKEAEEQKATDKIISKVKALQMIINEIDSRQTLNEKKKYISDLADKNEAVTCEMSWRGMADCDDAEQFIKEFRLISAPVFPFCRAPYQISVCDMNGYIYFNVNQFILEGNYTEDLKNELLSYGLSCELIVQEATALPKYGEI